MRMSTAMIDGISQRSIFSSETLRVRDITEEQREHENSRVLWWVEYIYGTDNETKAIRNELLRMLLGLEYDDEEEPVKKGGTGRPVLPCGTEAAIRRHYREKALPLDEKCREAYKSYRERVKKAKNAKKT